MKKILISTSTFGQHNSEPLDLLRENGFNVQLNPYGRKLKEEEALELLSDVDYLIAGTESLNEKILENSSKLKIISRCGVGVDNINVRVAEDKKIKIFHTSVNLTQSVAELTVALLLGLLRKMPHMDQDIKKGVWKKQMGSLLCGKNVGIIGYGRIGQKVAELLKPFGCALAAYDIGEIKSSDLVKAKSLEELLEWCEILTLHCSVSNSNGVPLLGASEFQKIKNPYWIINASRGELIDESVLLENLKSGHCRGAALDVFNQEPYEGPLAAMENVILTPHVGSYAMEARIAMEKESVENLLKGLEH